MWFRFNNQLDQEAFDPDMVTIEPAIPGANIQANYNGIYVHGRKKGKMTYKVTIKPNIKDVYKQ